MSHFFEKTIVWLIATIVLLGFCTYLPIRIKNDALRSWVMRWVLVPVSIIIIVYVYPVGIEIFRRLAIVKS